MTGIARLQLTVLDTPEPMALARFYSQLVGLPVAESETDHDWVELDGGGGPSLAFQLAPARRAPAWPEEGALQSHLDLEVDDLDAGEAAVLEAGATKHEHQPGEIVPGLPRPRGQPVLPRPERAVDRSGTS